MFSFIKKLLILGGEKEIIYETTCFKCKGIFPKEQLTVRRGRKYCHRCYWVDLVQMLGIGVGIVMVTLIFIVLFSARR